MEPQRISAALPTRRAGGRARFGADGRGARSNASGRYERFARVADPDAQIADEEAPPLATEVTVERPRSIVNYVESPFVGFDRSINPYRGCEHGCVYCFARPTHAFHGLSPGRDFETRLFAKPDAPAILERELAAKRYAAAPIAIGTNTDPYQPIERRYRIMAGLLRVLHRYRHPVSILTKSDRVLGDLDRLAAMAQDGIVRVMLSVTTLDAGLARSLEPRAATPRRRLEAVRRLADAGVPTGVMTAPIIPGLNDSELEALLEAARDAGAAFVGYTILRLPLEVADLFREWLEAAAPDRAKRVLRLVRETSGDEARDPDWANSRTPGGVHAELIARRFRGACRRLGLATDIPPLDGSTFRRPLDDATQLSLFAESPPG